MKEALAGDSMKLDLQGVIQELGLLHTYVTQKGAELRPSLVKSTGCSSRRLFIPVP
jgi:hypothetical protein